LSPRGYASESPGYLRAFSLVSYGIHPNGGMLIICDSVGMYDSKKIVLGIRLDTSTLKQADEFVVCEINLYSCHYRKYYGGTAPKFCMFHRE